MTKTKLLLKLKLLLERVKNIVGRGENASYQQTFSVLPQCFFKKLFRGAVKTSLCAKRLNLSQTTNFRLFQTERACRRQF